MNNPHLHKKAKRAYFCYNLESYERKNKNTKTKQTKKKPLSSDWKHKDSIIFFLSEKISIYRYFLEIFPVQIKHTLKYVE